jgi:hypothetical protein
MRRLCFRYRRAVEQSTLPELVGTVAGPALPPTTSTVGFLFGEAGNSPTLSVLARKARSTYTPHPSFRHRHPRFFESFDTFIRLAIYLPRVYCLSLPITQISGTRPRASK